MGDNQIQTRHENESDTRDQAGENPDDPRAFPQTGQIARQIKTGQ